MKLLRITSVLVAILGLASLAVLVAPAVRDSVASRVSAQSADSGQDRRPERPVDSAQGRRAREFTVLGGGAGIGVRVVDRDGAVVIDDVVPDGPADKAGLKRSDVVVEFDGERVRSARQFARLVQETQPGRPVKATVRRDGQRKDVQVTPDERRGDVMVSGEFGDYMRDLGREMGRLGDRMPFNFNFDFDFPGMMGVAGRRLGVSVQELTPQLADYFGVKSGLLVTAVTDGSSAATAGLKAGDIITSLNNTRVATRTDLLRGLRDATGDEVTIGIVRDRKESSVKAKIEPARRITRGRPV